MINQTLLNSWNGYSFGLTLNQLAGNREWYIFEPSYFFLRKELSVTAQTWNDAKRRGEIRHCKIYRGKFLDYVVRKEFATLQDWVKDAGGRMEDVLYGENRVREMEWQLIDNQHRHVPKTAKYVELSVLLKHLGYEPPKVEIPEYKELDIEEITKQMGMLMAERDLGIQNVWVIHEGIPTQWTEFIKS